MPIFEYRCDDCQNEFEELVMGDQEVTCPGCKSGKVTKLLSSFAAAGGSSSVGAAGGSITSGGGCGSSGFS